MNNKIFIPGIDQKYVDSITYIINDQNVILNYELAKIYQCTVDDLNKQVNDNIEKFPTDFRFQLTEEDVKALADDKGVVVDKETYAFTESGIHMLITVLNNEIAINQSKQLINAIKSSMDILDNNEEEVLYEINPMFAAIHNAFKNADTNHDSV